MTNIVIPDGVTRIGSSAFRGRFLISITIPGSVKSIGEEAFFFCSALTDITFGGTKAQWNAIRKGNKWNVFTIDYIIHCTDGDISKN